MTTIDTEVRRTAAERAMLAALGVITLDARISAWLAEHDPNALAQAREARYAAIIHRVLLEAKSHQWSLIGVGDLMTEGAQPAECQGIFDQMEKVEIGHQTERFFELKREYLRY